MDINERQELLNALIHGTVTVTFQKVNGELRVMPCTLNSAVLMANNAITSDFKLEEDLKKKPESIISVWATDVNGWRSFRVENLVSWEVLGE